MESFDQIRDLPRYLVWVTRTATRKVPTKEIAMVLAAMEELDNSGRHINALTDSIQPYLRPNTDQDIFDEACKEAAGELADSKVDESLRTYLAILGYLFSLSGAFIDAVDKDSEKPGNRIAFAMLFSWLIPAVLLSAATRRFCSSGSCQRIMERFQWSLVMGRFQCSLHHPHRVCDSGSETIRKPRQPSFCDGVSSIIEVDLHATHPWAGAVYTYRPEKQIFATGSGGDRRPLLLFLFASLPVILSISCAFTISYHTPTVGLGCRSILQLVIGLLWCLSALISWLLGKLRFLEGKYLWRIILVKDTLIGIPALLAVILVNIGIFNSCWCWSAIYSRGREHAFIALSSDAGREENSRLKYPATVFVNVGLLLILVLGMRYGEGYGLRCNNGEKREKRPGVIE